MTQPEPPCAQQPSRETDDMRRARAILRERSGAVPPQELFELARRLRGDDRFGLARRVLALARSRPVRDVDLARRLRQTHALCTSKDADLPADRRLDLALRILGDGEDLSTTTDQETLGLAGAIHKRRWQLDLRRENLELALHYYRRGHEVGAASDRGYTGINTAYVLDLLASIEWDAASAAGTVSAVAAERRSEARGIRAELTRVLGGLIEADESLARDWWVQATLIEAWFGLHAFDEAARRTDAALAIEGVPDWEYRTTATQLASLARIMPEPPSDAPRGDSAPDDVLRKLLGGRAAALRNAMVGRIGLALSGGGFRASLYHIGVLAALADMDVLRHVEVLSCVSGGSIIGAQYYLEVRKLLESKPDDAITRDDYIAIVGRLETHFLDGVQRNLRMRVVGGFGSNLKLIFSSGHSRTKRIGELYEKHLFSAVDDGGGTAGERWMTELFMRPAGDRADFQPRRDNWRRTAKAPDLVLNATTLNTGHNWRFTASWMGEAPTQSDDDIDTNYRLRRMYYAEAPAAHRCVRLGHAVAASSCVPGLFEPLSLEGLYPGRTVRLVDGGVHDNQGVAALLEEDCNVILVSDASGQMGTVDVPGSGTLAVPLRSNSILMSRVRAAQYQDLRARYRSKLLGGLMFVHLRQGLGAAGIDWVGCDEPADPADPAGATVVEGLSPELLERLSALRTDLDSFSDAEACALMYAGWRMTEAAFGARELDWLPRLEGERHDWTFREIESHLRVPSRRDRLLSILDAGRHRAFKVWRLVPGLRVAGSLLVLMAGLALAWLLWKIPDDYPLVTAGAVTSTLLGAALAAVFGAWINRVRDPGGAARRILAGIFLALFGWIIAGVHLAIFNPLFLRVGRIRARRGKGASP